MGAAVTQQAMGMIVGSFGEATGSMSADAFHSAFLLPVAGLIISIGLYAFARDFGQQG
jgi:hypothetical protein